jgi:translation initiation factor 6 (eIF-6)
MIAINEKSTLENTDLKTAAYNMMQDLREYRNLENLHLVIAQAEKGLSALGNSIRQNEAAIATLVNLQLTGYSEKQITELASVISNCRS